MTQANVPDNLRARFFPEAATTATMLDNLTVIAINGVTQTRYEHCFGRLPKWTEYLRPWGEAGVVTNKVIGTPKAANKGITCMLIGFSDRHAAGCYRMWNEETNRILITRDINFLNRMFYVKNKEPNEVIMIDHYEAGEGPGNVPESSVGTDQNYVEDCNENEEREKPAGTTTDEEEENPFTK